MSLGKTTGGTAAANTPPNAQNINRQYIDAMFPSSRLSIGV